MFGDTTVSYEVALKRTSKLIIRENIFAIHLNATVIFFKLNTQVPLVKNEHKEKTLCFN